MKSIYVLDAVNFLFRSYYAIGPMTNPKGESTGALYGFIRSVFKIIKEFAPGHLIAVFDGPESSKKRKEIYSEYKMHRKHMPEDLYSQLLLAHEFCTIAGIPYLSVTGVEADDVMGSIAKWASGEGATVYLCTSDKDLAQFVDDKVFVINPFKENLLLDRAKVKELYGVYPEQIVDLLALMGDASDNIPGLEGIGPKTAIAMLNEFGNLQTILDHPERLTGKKREIVENGRKDAQLSYDLAVIHTDVDFPREEPYFRLRQPELEKVKAFYQQMHFMSLLKELQLPEKKSEQLNLDFGIDEKKVTYTLINDEHELETLIKLLEKEKELCIDTETTGLDPMQADLVGIGVGFEPHVAWYIPMNGQMTPSHVIERLKPLLQNPEISFYGHNIKYDLHALRKAGISSINVSFDTMIASYLLAPQKQRHGLDPLTLELFHKVKIPITDLIGKGKNQITMSEVPLEQVAAYCCEDVDYTIRLKKRFKKELDDENLESVFSQIEMPLLPILFEMEERGIFLDVEKMHKMNEDLTAQIEILSQEIFSLAGEPFNLNSPKQLSHILFEKMGIKPLQKTTTGYSTNAEVLEELKSSSPIIAKIIDYRLLEKLRSTYVAALPEVVNPRTKRIHCNFNQTGTATGRLSCQDPNLQNIPVRSPAGKRIRSAFEPELQGWSYVGADYSQIELRLLAHFSEDPVLMKAFQEGEDIHAYTAAQVFGVPLAEVKDEMRHAAKAVNFGILYGQQAFGLSKELGIPFDEAKKFIETYFSRYPKVRDYLEQCKESVRRTGMSITLTGRKRPIPEIHSKNPLIRSSAERLAVNTPLQGTAADLIKLAMIEINKKVKDHLILQIHDELIFEVPDSEAAALGDEVKEIMQNVFKLKVPLVVDISIGKNWGEC